MPYSHRITNSYKQMKKIFLLAFILLLAGCQKAPFEAKTLETDYLTIEHPIEWNVATQNQLAEIPQFAHVVGTYIFTPKQEENSKPIQFIITVEQIKEGKSTAAYLDQTKTILENNSEKVTVIGEGTGSIGGENAVTLMHKNATPIGDYLWDQTWVQEGNKLYTVSFSRPDEETSQEFQTIIDYMTQSITLKDTIAKIREVAPPTEAAVEGDVAEEAVEADAVVEDTEEVETTE